ncbi:MAG: hypothetical protein ACW99A_22405, partial [Candidatus Kariarchaeaceae archaeon]
SASIGSFSSGDFVEYFVRAIGEDGSVLYNDRDPDSGYKSFTAQLSPEISWVSPANGATIYFEGENNPFTFSFDWSYSHLDDAQLIIGGNTFDILNGGTKTTSVSINYASNLDGLVTAQLKGFKDGTEVNAYRTFNFEWVRFVDQYLEESGNEVIGDKLYLIIHDPAGDNSASNFAQTQTITMNAGIEVTGGVSITAKAGGGLFGVGGEASAGVSLEATVGAEFSYSMSVGTALSSSQVSDDPAFMGPGRGDYYWGEAWIFHWQIMSTKTTYWNGDADYTNPELIYGIERDLEVFIGDHEASALWKNFNPVWNDYEGVSWLDSKAITGGAPFSEFTKYQTTSTLSASITVTISSETKAKFFFGSSKVELSLSTSLSSSISSENEEILGYTIEDDDPTDLISQEVGIDNRFGTYVFRTHSYSTTSNPLETGTRDYQAPVVDFPIISLDTDGSSPSPSQDDSPLVTAVISDEGGISKAVVWYSSDGGISYGRVDMSEQIGNPGTWQANLPKQSHGTTIHWYIEVWDNTDNAAVRKDVNGNDYEYKVLNRDPTVTVISPNGGETLSKEITISWLGSDLDDDLLSYSIGYNLDNQGWTLIASGITEQSYLWDISGFLDSDNVLIKVIANDGFGGSVEDESDFVFNIDNADTPTATITSPLSGLTYTNTITLNWDLTDIDDLTTSLDLHYSTNSGVDWHLIEDNLPSSTRNYDWDTSTIVFSESTRIKVTVHFVVEFESRTTADLSDIFIIDNRPELDVSLI